MLCKIKWPGLKMIDIFCLALLLQKLTKTLILQNHQLTNKFFSRFCPEKMKTMIQPENTSTELLKILY